MGCVQEAGMNHKGFKKVYSEPGYPIDPKLASERENALPEQKFVPIFRGVAIDKEIPLRFESCYHKN